TSFADARFFQVILDFPPQQFRVVRQRIERQARVERLLRRETSPCAPRHHSLQMASIQRQPKHGGETLFFTLHFLWFASKIVWRTSWPSAQPKWLKSCRKMIFGFPSVKSKTNFARR